MFDSLKTKFSGLVEGVSSKKITEKDLNKILEDFELSLLESDVSLLVSEKIVNELKKKLSGEKIGLTSNKKDFVKTAVEEGVCVCACFSLACFSLACFAQDQLSLFLKAERFE